MEVGVWWELRAGELLSAGVGARGEGRGGAVCFFMTGAHVHWVHRCNRMACVQKHWLDKLKPLQQRCAVRGVGSAARFGACGPPEAGEQA